MSTRAANDNFRVTRSIVSELVSKKSQGDEKQFMKCCIDADFNDFYLRYATEEGVQNILSCDESFARGFMSKVLTKLRSDCLPPEAEPASTAEYNKAVEHFENCKPEHGKQSEYINALFLPRISACNTQFYRVGCGVSKVIVRKAIDGRRRKSKAFERRNLSQYNHNSPKELQLIV